MSDKIEVTLASDQAEDSRELGEKAYALLLIRPANNGYVLSKKKSKLDINNDFYLIVIIIACIIVVSLIEFHLACIQ